MDAFALQDFRLLITGAGTGMGRASALAAARAGAKHLLLCGRRAEKLAETAAVIATIAPSCRTLSLPGDICSTVYRQQLLAAVQDSGGALDTLINNAGQFSGQSAAATSDEEWQAIYDINVAAPFALTRDLLTMLARSRQASVINISSTLALKPIPVAAAYNSAKAALLQMSRSLALELAPQSIRVNCILPAVVETPMYAGRFRNAQEEREGLVQAAKLHPLGRIGQPEDIAHAVQFLASPAAAWITGAALAVDGGMLCT